MKAKVQRLRLPPDRRIVVVSDIHGHLSHFKGLLEQINFGGDDVLILLGDMVEKGPRSLDTLRFIMALEKDHTVYPLCGNCDGFYLASDIENPDKDHYLLRYIRTKPQALLSQMCREIGLDPGEGMDMEQMRRAVGEHFKEELDFLRELPTIIETEHYTFVHGGLPPGPLEELDADQCMKNYCFMRQGRSFDKYCIVGHWPVMLYGEDITCANPIIDRESKIISIDGGCVLKDDGQLNALIIPRDGSFDFDFDYYDGLPKKRVVTAQEGSDVSAYFKFGDKRIRVLERGDEFSLCQHVRTGYRMEILTKYLAGDGKICLCNDCTDYRIPLEAGDLVSVIEETSKGYLVKHKGVSGWYYGELA